MINLNEKEKYFEDINEDYIFLCLINTAPLIGFYFIILLFLTHSFLISVFLIVITFFLIQQIPKIRRFIYLKLGYERRTNFLKIIKQDMEKYGIRKTS